MKIALSQIFITVAIDTVTCLREVKEIDHLTKEQKLFLVASAKIALASLETAIETNPEIFTPEHRLIAMLGGMIIIDFYKEHNIDLQGICQSLEPLQTRVLNELMGHADKVNSPLPNIIMPTTPHFDTSGPAFN